MRRSLLAAKWTVEELLALDADDLTAIKGISVMRERTLNDMGLFTYAQLVDIDPEKVSSMMGPLVNVRAVQDWQKQAASMES